MGHEASGEIAELGEGAARWEAGTRVTFDSTVYCGKCSYCQSGAVNLCDHRRVLGVSCDEYRCEGAFADLVVVPQHILCRLPDAVTFEQATMTEPLSIAVHAVHRATAGHLPRSARAESCLGPVPPGPPGERGSAVVVGAGMIGLLIVQALRAAGWKHIIAVDLDAERLRLAKRLGAHASIKADETDVPNEVARLTAGKGADAALEAVGATPSVQAAISCVRKGGTVVLVGNLAKEVSLPLQTTVTRELNVFGSCASAGEYPECLELIARGAVNVDALISAVAPLSEGAQWFERLKKKNSGLMKVILRTT
jgi:L-iditol 2-dehydrogenase